MISFCTFLTPVHDIAAGILCGCGSFNLCQLPYAYLSSVMTHVNQEVVDKPTTQGHLVCVGLEGLCLLLDDADQRVKRNFTCRNNG